MRIFSSSPSFGSTALFLTDCSTICFDACSVTMVLMMQVKRIIMTTPLSAVWSMRNVPLPGASSISMPTITIAMAPAACADVSPNIMFPAAHGSRITRHEAYAAMALPSVPKMTIVAMTTSMPPPSNNIPTSINMPTPMRKYGMKRALPVNSMRFMRGETLGMNRLSTSPE